MVRLNLSSDGGKIEFKFRWGKKLYITTFVKECEKIIECKEKSISNLAYKQGLLFEKSNEPDKFRETYKKWSK